jgi:D-galactarolactone isomerase
MDLPIPIDACDSHFHILDTSYPTIANPSVPHFNASIDDYRTALGSLGTRRGIIVHPSLYGTDNRCTLAALSALGKDFRAVAVIDDSITRPMLEEWHALGVRGVRFNQIQKGATTMDMLRATADRIADFGWHVQLHMKAQDLADHEALLLQLPVPLVLDHFGRVELPLATDHRGWLSIQRLIGRGMTWVKLSGPYHETRSGPPAYADSVEIGRRYIELAEDRMLWGSDWPHVTEKERPKLADLMNGLRASVDNETQFRKILVDNPASLYGF